ncbi:MAG: helix-turn-helix transcriptional regulator [Acidobacteriota bacterium]|nr:helix-turn-helix transcriptional regulator [Acidobacteriota bacterium]
MKIYSVLSDEAVLRELGTRLAALRLAHNLTQATLAQEAGVSKRTIERLEAGEVATRLSALVRVCRVLGLVDRLDTLVPVATPGPVEQLKRAGRERQRASKPRQPASAKARKWTWGDKT